jgi:transcriptional regulator with XRE-family HTH domain
MFALNLTSPTEILNGVAARMKRRRLDLNLTQRALASRSGVSYGSLRLFEETGKASFEAVMKIAFALEAEAEFEALFPPRPVKTPDDVVGRPVRRRARPKGKLAPVSL